MRQTPELREAVYSLINRDVERALSGLESVKPSQVPRLEGAWAPEHSVTEFSHSQEAKLAEAQQKAMLKGEAFPDIPMTLYEAIVRDYTGRTPEAREQTLIVTHLNEDRRVLNSMIHDAREKAGELGKEQVMVPVLNTANIRDGELRRLSTWEKNPDALALVDNVYHRIAGISKDDGLITLQDAEGNTRLISPREAVAEGVTLYTPDKIRVGTGDRMRFTKSDRERGYVANSVWTVTAVSGDSVTLSDGQQTRVIRPGQERAEQHIDLAYAITAHGAQGASETFAIALEGTEGNRKLMAGFESAYVALSRMKQHVQVYTDNRQGWTDAINNAVQKGTAHDVLEPKPDREVMNAQRLFSTARELRGRPVSSEPSQPQPRARKSLLSDDAFMLWRVPCATMSAHRPEDVCVRFRYPPRLPASSRTVPAREPSSSLTSTEEWPAAPCTPVVRDIPATSVLSRSPSRRTKP